MPRFSLKILSSLGALLIAGCTQVGLGIANLPAKLGDLEIEKNIAYGAQEWQKLDIYTPKNAQSKKLPVIVFFHGGRWSEGSKDMYAFVGKAFADKNYIVAIADYSKYPDVKFPSFVEDAAKAIAWVHSNIDEYGGNADKLFVSGHSSGAHIGSLAIADQRYLKEEGKSPDIVTAFAGLAGPYDFIPEADDLKDMFGPPEKYPQMTVTTFIDGDEPPMLLLWGAKDNAVWQRNIDLLKEGIEKKDGIVETKIYPELDHVGIISSLTWFFRSKAPVLKDVDQFFKKYE